MKKKTIFWVFIGGVCGLLISYLTAFAVHNTASYKTCSMCHTMEPMIQSYKADIHGGKNPRGLQADCVTCHLPGDSLGSYLLGKIKISAHDAWAELTYDKSKIDWHAKRKEAKHFVYDTGCLSCHKNLQNSTSAGKAFLAHKDYFDKKTTKTCVECHEQVGHDSLGIYLNAMKGK